MTVSVLLIGPPGAGKGTLAAVLAQRFDLHHVNSGALLRDAAAAGTPLGRIAAEHMSRGAPVPDRLVTDLVAQAIGTDRPLVIDGFPKTLVQGRALIGLLRENGRAVGPAVELVADRAVLRRRLIARGIRDGRADDASATVERRLAAFGDTPGELLAYLREVTTLTTVDANAPKESVAAVVIALVGAALGPAPTHTNR